MIVVETSVLVAIVTAEPGYERLLDAVIAADDPVLPASCLLEAHMVVRGRFPPAMSETLDGVRAATGLRVLAFTPEHADAARAAFDRYGRGRHPAGLNFGDCMAYAVAKVEAAPLLYVGGDFGRTDVEGWDECFG